MGFRPVELAGPRRVRRNGAPKAPDAAAGGGYAPRSASKAATWARSSGTPSPVRAEVKNTLG